MIIVEHSGDTRIPEQSQLISINKHPIDDFLEFNFYNDVSDWRYVVVQQGTCTKHIEFKPEEQIPITLQAPVYRTCENDCHFCFVRGLPPGLRGQLYVRDDDYRLSFLFGNFLSLTNLSDSDIKRIGRLRLSPLYVSVHTTDSDLRIDMFKNKQAGKILEQLQSLIREQIQLHCQIVVIPGLNDGAMLRKSITDLGALFPGVASIGVIPVGRTRYAPSIPLVTRTQANKIITLVTTMQQRFRKQYDSRIVYAADELFILGGCDIPPATYYDEMPQIENGIGMVRSFCEDIDAVHISRKIKGRVLLVTGSYAAPFISHLREILIKHGSIPASDIDIVTIENKFFGPTVTVSGLLGARDIDRTIRSRASRYDRIILPPNCTNDAHEFIDSNRLSVDATVAPHSLQELVQWLQS